MSPTKPELVKPEPTTSASEIAVQCIGCDAKLLTRSIRTTQHVRCSLCGVYQFPGEEKVERIRGLQRLTRGPHRRAWWSLLLGIVSFVFLFFTGIPSIYYGIRSLLQMRYTKPGPGDKKAAVFGVIFGTIFGVFWGGLLAFAGLIVLFFFMTFQNSQSAEEAAKIFHEGYAIELPKEIYPTSAIALLNTQNHFRFRDDDRHVRLAILHFHQAMEMNRTQLKGNFNEFRLISSPIDVAVADSEEMSWTILGKERDVQYTKREVVCEDPENEGEQQTIVTHTYWSILKHKQGIVGMKLSFRDPPYAWSRDEVRAMFESFAIKADQKQQP